MALDSSKVVETNLPKLPVPNVEKTLSRYLDAIEAFIPKDDFSNTKAQVQQLLQDKQAIQDIEAMLKERAEKEENWVYEWWLNDMYLNNMVPLPVVSNPAWVFPRQNFATRAEMFNYLAQIVHGISLFKQDIENNTLKFDSGLKLCMRQYDRILTSYRIPGLGKDTLKTWDAKLKNQDEHIIVMTNRYMYKMFIKRAGTWMSTFELSTILTEIFQDSSSRPVNPIDQCVPLLTSDSRSNWARARLQILQDSTNQNQITAVETCLFVVCIDQMIHNMSDNDRSQHEMFRQVLTAGGAKFNATNRWFDKTIQIIVSEDGVCGMNYEHTTSEGVAVVTMIQEILKKMTEQTNTASERTEITESSNNYSRIEWILNEEVKEAITAAAQNINRLDEDVDIEVFRFPEFGKSLMKNCNCSPDSFVQMAMQLTYFRLYNTLCATYESASLRRFQQGRVDSIRASHTSALAWVRAMASDLDQNVLQLDQKKQLFLEAIKTQTRIMKENIFGEGLDIPLLGIRMACQELWPDKTLDIFKDPSFQIANHFKLSTSQVPIGLEDSYMGYGAVVPDGYGVSYNLQNDGIIFCIASFFSCEETSSIRFAHTLQQSLLDIKQLFQQEEEKMREKEKKREEIQTDDKKDKKEEEKKEQKEIKKEVMREDEKKNVETKVGENEEENKVKEEEKIEEIREEEKKEEEENKHKEEEDSKEKEKKDRKIKTDEKKGDEEKEEEKTEEIKEEKKNLEEKDEEENKHKQDEEKKDMKLKTDEKKGDGMKAEDKKMKEKENKEQENNRETGKEEKQEQEQKNGTKKDEQKPKEEKQNGQKNVEREE